jgi:2-C-methyl-D-erythritol 2,4-cyclodiphosphate synthase
MHAICDAVLGSIGLSDIGRIFPNTDPQWKNVPSKIFLQEAARRIKDVGGDIVNVDSSIIAEAPKISPYVETMKSNIAAALGITPQQVGVKATTNEGLGFAGRKEGIAAFAVASIEIKNQH